jgi:hypothetical protein
VNVLRADAIAGLEFRVGRRGAAEFAAHHHALDVRDGELAALERFRGLHGVARGDVLGGNEALVDQHVFEAEKPLLVV